MSTYSPDQAPEPEIGEEPCRHCGHHCESAEECRDSRAGSGFVKACPHVDFDLLRRASKEMRILGMKPKGYELLHPFSRRGNGPPTEKGAPF